MNRLTETALGLLAGFLLDDRSDAEQFADAVAANPAKVGLMIDATTVVVIRDKTLRVSEGGSVVVRLAKGAGQEAKVETLKSGAQLDVVELRRAAAIRAGKAK